MIKDQFLYFAQYPSKEGVRAILTNGASDFPGYNDLAESLDKLPNVSRLPEIDNYVYGQSFDELKQRIDKLVGSFLFVDYGELGMLADGRNSYQITQRIAITVANKMPNRADAAEYMLSSDSTLRLLSKVHAWMLADAEHGNIEWLSRGELDKAEFVPFVATELSSVGWTLMLTCIAPDSLSIHQQSRSFAKQL
ncbi:hypothetical protein HMPREF0647_04765 [Prevotella bivia DNF00320]|uniref:Uncharacterized protein n=1 Tax=Prevotella bivia DNF00320 TaxID=1401068 RepID=A0A096BQL7_9BACT|nr:hypothetical protein [Prevotella bivia]KGF44967.1 hypothetical protein HMPREF0647_04765 [Prevotella bivia DNF00320]